MRMLNLHVKGIMDMDFMLLNSRNYSPVFKLRQTNKIYDLNGNYSSDIDETVYMQSR